MEAEKRFEAAAAKGHRPCPVPSCKKLQDVSEKEVFKSSAFEPTEDDLERQSNEKRRKKRIAAYESSDDEDIVVRFDQPEEEDDDDEFPDILDIMPASKKKKTKKSTDDDDDVLDLTMADVTGSSSGFGKGRKPNASPAGKRKSRDDDDEQEEEIEKHTLPSESTLATWRRGDDDMEPSTKMMSLINFLREWDSTGDKTICYSQCGCVVFANVFLR